MIPVLIAAAVVFGGPTVYSLTGVEIFASFCQAGSLYARGGIQFYGRLHFSASPRVKRQLRLWETLTRRQRQILGLLGCGVTNQKLASALGIVLPFRTIDGAPFVELVGRVCRDGSKVQQ